MSSWYPLQKRYSLRGLQIIEFLDHGICLSSHSQDRYLDWFVIIVHTALDVKIQFNIVNRTHLDVMC